MKSSSLLNQEEAALGDNLGLSRPNIEVLRQLIRSGVPEQYSVPNEVIEIELSGRRCILLQELQSELSDGLHGTPIIIPDNARQPLAAGWIVNIGHFWGLPGQTDDRSTMFGMFRSRWDILGHKVLFGDWVGQDLFLGLTDRRFQSRFKVLSEHEIWGLVERLDRPSIQS